MKTPGPTALHDTSEKTKVYCSPFVFLLPIGGSVIPGARGGGEREGPASVVTVTL